jgi:hypothetical protein
MNEGSPASSKWYWSKRGSDERNGPVSGAKLKELAEEGDLEPDDLVWTQGMDDWEEASSVKGVKDFFESPPPLPEESVEEGEAQEETPPSLPEIEESGEDSDSEFPLEFEVKWGGSVFSTESTLRLYEDGIGLYADDGSKGGKIEYIHFDVKSIEGNEITVEAPSILSGLGEDLFTLKFKNVDKAKKARKLVGYIESKNGNETVNANDGDGGKKSKSTFICEKCNKSKKKDPDITSTRCPECGEPMSPISEENSDTENSLLKQHPIWAGVTTLVSLIFLCFLIGAEETVGLFSLATLCWFVYALFKPSKAVYWHQNPSRVKAFGYLFAGFLILGAIGSSFEDSTSDESLSANSQTDSAKVAKSDGVNESESGQGECSDISGTYTGTYRQEEGLYEVEGDGRFKIEDNCEYEWYSSTSIDDGKYEGGPRRGKGEIKRDGESKILFNYADGGDALEGTYVYEAYIEESFWSGKKELVWEEEVEVGASTITEWKFELERTRK